jgi:hypothetical protein
MSLNACQGRARDEGFELLQDASEIGAFRRLRSFVASSPHLARLQNEARGDGRGEPHPLPAGHPERSEGFLAESERFLGPSGLGMTVAKFSVPGSGS